MKRIRWIVLATVLVMTAVFTLPSAGLAHELNMRTAAFSGNYFAGGADVDGDVNRFFVEAYAGSFKFEDQRGKPALGDLASAFAVDEEWWLNEDGTCTIVQETWESQSRFWTEDQSEASLIFTDQFNGSLNVEFMMHGFRATYENNPFPPGADWCGWDEEEPPDFYEHLDPVSLTVSATWESEIIDVGKGKKNKGQVVATTVTFDTVEFNGLDLDIIVRGDPVNPSPFGNSRYVGRDVATFYDYIDNH